MDWPSFSLDPETVSTVLRSVKVPGHPQHRGTEGLKCHKEHNSLIGDVQRTVDVPSVERPDKLSKEEQKRTNSTVGGRSPEDTDADQAQKANHNHSGNLPAFGLGQRQPVAAPTHAPKQGCAHDAQGLLMKSETCRT